MSDLNLARLWQRLRLPDRPARDSSHTDAMSPREAPYVGRQCRGTGRDTMSAVYLSRMTGRGALADSKSAH